MFRRTDAQGWLGDARTCILLPPNGGPPVRHVPCGIASKAHSSTPLLRRFPGGTQETGVRVGGRARTRREYGPRGRGAGGSRVKYANHEFVVTVLNGRAELFQSFQWRYGVGLGIEHAKTLADEDVEVCLANMARGGKVAEEVQVATFGYALSTDVAGVFGYEKAEL